MRQLNIVGVGYNLASRVPRCLQFSFLGQYLGPKIEARPMFFGPFLG